MNAAFAKCCKSVLHSKHRHDFVWCACKKVAIDGGNDYRKVVGEFGRLIRIHTEEQLKMWQFIVDHMKK